MSIRRAIGPARLGRVVGVLSAAAMATTMASPTQAILVTDLTGFKNPVVSTSFDPIPVDTFSSGPIEFVAANGDRILFSSSNSTTQSGSVINYRNGYGFASNGLWQDPLLMAGLNASEGFMDFKFLKAPVSGAGGFLNWAPGSGPSSMSITALDSSANILESYSLNFTTTGAANTGRYFYILRNAQAPDITTLRIRDAYAGIAEFTFDAPVAPAPLPFAGAALAYAYSRSLKKRIGKC